MASAKIAECTLSDCKLVTSVCTRAKTSAVRACAASAASCSGAVVVVKTGLHTELHGDTRLQYGLDESDDQIDVFFMVFVDQKVVYARKLRVYHEVIVALNQKSQENCDPHSAIGSPSMRAAGGHGTGPQRP